MKRTLATWVGGLVLFGWLVFAIWFPLQQPHSPDPSTGRTWPIANHGSTAYVSFPVWVLYFSPFIVGVVIAAFSVISRVSKGKK